MTVMTVRTESGNVVRGTLRPDGSVDIGERCTHCGCDVSFGSGNYVNRIPSGYQRDVDSPDLDGYMCAGCQTMTCEECGQPTLDYSMKPEGGVICDECAGKEM